MWATAWAIDAVRDNLLINTALFPELLSVSSHP